MHVLHPSLKYSPALDKHFMRVIQKIENSGEEKMLDEHNSTQYKDLLIGQTRELYIRQQERERNHRDFHYQRKMGEQNFLDVEAKDK